MALPTSGTITLEEIKAEFGGPGNLSSYHRGGTYVPNVSVNNNVPTSGIITILNFYGAVNTSVQLTNQNFNCVASGLSNAGCETTFFANGVLQFVIVKGSTPTYTNIPGEWLISGSASNYDIYASIVSFTKTGTGTYTGTFNTWIGCGSSPTWYVTAPESISSADISILFQIKNVSTGGIVASATIGLNASTPSLA